MADKYFSAEEKRLNDNAGKKVPLEKWGPYLSERQWGTVREDYSANGDAWNYFTHDQSRSRVYRWGEDGMGGISDYMQNICFSVALWNHKDPILKERLFGLTNQEGNHGEDVKELYYYMDNIPTHYYMKFLYKYPQKNFPYNELIEKNKLRTKEDPEFEILDSGAFSNNEYFDVFIEYAKQNSEDIFIKIEIVNRASQAAEITLLPTLWFYNRWQYGGLDEMPSISFENEQSVKASHQRAGTYYFYFPPSNHLLFTENESNNEKLFGKPNKTGFTKDAFHDAVISQKNTDALKNKKQGTKFSPVYHFNIAANASEKIILRLSNQLIENAFQDAETIFDLRKKEADEFYNSILHNQSQDLKNIQRQAFAGLLWNKQYYHFDVERWLHTSDGITPVTESRLNGRNHTWKYLKNQDIILMPDKWEYPWYAAWDTAFHCISMAIIDPTFAKHQLLLLMREWYMNPDGQIPAYEWNFSDVNPPVHAFAALEVYRIEKEKTGTGDIEFLKKIFQKLLINFTWWTNREDASGNNVFEGGFLGLDNIGLFNRSNVLPDNFLLEQSDGTSWMGMYALTMMDIALEISTADPSFEDSCTKFYEHFVLIAEALNDLGLWNEEDQFFYDMLSVDGKQSIPLKIRSAVGIVPLFAVAVMRSKEIEKLDDFKKRMSWFKEYRSSLKKYLPNEISSHGEATFLSLVHKDRLIKILERLFDEKEFLSPGGIRALSKFYQSNPYSINVGGNELSIHYDPGDSTSGLFGGNSNWRGPVWMPINYLIIKAIKKSGEFYGDSLKIEFPTGSGNQMNLKDVAKLLAQRIIQIFQIDDKGERKIFGDYNWFYQQQENKNLLLFNEYFHGDNLRGLGASHQTGWTALIANLMWEA